MHRLFPFALLLAVACDTPNASPAKAAAPPASAPSASASAPAATDGAADPAATIGGVAVPLAEVDKKAAAGLIKARQDMFAARDQALQGLIHERLFDAEAKAKGITTEELLKAEIEDKAKPVTDAEIEAFFAQNQQRMRGGIDQMREQIRGYLEQQTKGARMMEYVDELKKKNDVVVFLEPPRIHVDAGDSPRYGSPDAPVQIIEFSDFQCPYCTRGADTLTEVKEKYGDKISVVFRHFPLDFHDKAQKAAEASECANDQGKFWEYHDQLFANQQAMGQADLERYATVLELDVAAFTECLNSGKHAPTVATDLEDGAAAGMSGTPGFFVNGRFIGGAQPIEVFSEIIDAELAKKG